MELNTYLIVRQAYAAWKSQDLEAFGNCLAPDVEFEVTSSEPARSYVGIGKGRQELVARLRSFLDGYEVAEFTIASANPIDDNSIVFRVQYDYRSMTNGLDIQGAQRHRWTVRGNEITSFTVIHDAKRLGAFFELTQPQPSSPAHPAL